MNSDIEPGEITLAARLRRPFWLAAIALFFLALWGWREMGIRAAHENEISQEAEIQRLTAENSLLKVENARLAAGVQKGPASDSQAMPPQPAAHARRP